MDLLILFAAPGVVGGVVIGFLFIRLNRGRQADGPAYAFRDDPVSTDIINVARIRVAGVGGVGLIAVALAVAVSIPWIGVSLGLGLVLGAMLAAALILWQRRAGPMPSSGRRPGANTTLSIDAPLSAQDERDDYPSKLSTEVPGLSSTAPHLA